MDLNIEDDVISMSASFVSGKKTMDELITLNKKDKRIEFGKATATLNFTLEYEGILSRLKGFIKSLVDYPYKLDPLAEDHQKYYFKCKKCGMNFAKGFTFKAFLLHINNEPMCSYYAVRKNRKELPDFRFLAKQVSCSTWASELDSLANKAAGVIMHNNEAEDAFETFLYSELRAVLDVAFIATSNSSFTVINNEIFKSIRSSNITYEVNKVLQTAAWSIEISVMKEFNNTNALTSIIVDGWKSAAKHNILGVCLL